MSRDPVADIAAILHPIPDRKPPAWPDNYRTRQDWAELVALGQQREVADRLRDREANALQDPLIDSLKAAAAAKTRADRQLRHLLAYGREFVQPRPYTLDALAAAAGMSESGVRTGYDHDDVQAVAAATGATPREGRASDPEPPLTLDELLADLRRRSPSAERVDQLRSLLEHDGWTPSPPGSRTGGRSTRRYILWRRTWPHGTTVTLYQDPTALGTGNNVAQADPRRLYVSYAVDTLNETVKALAELEQRVTTHDAGRADEQTTAPERTR